MKAKLSKQKTIDSYIGRLINLGIIVTKQLNTSKKEIEHNPKKIIIYKLEAIGDSILLLPTIKHLKEQTKSKIIVACSNSNEEIFKYHKFIDKIVVFNISNPKDILNKLNTLRKEKADISIDGAQASNISAIFSWLTSKYSIGFKKTKGTSRNLVYDSSINLNPNKHMVLNYFDLLKPLDIKHPKKIKLVKLFSNYNFKFKDYIVVHPCNIFQYKTWPQERWVEVINYLSKKNEIVIIGSKEESPLVIELLKNINKKNITNLSGIINIKELISIIKTSKLFVGIDGGTTHIATSLQIPTISLMGHESPLRYAPFSKNSIALYKNPGCSPCVASYADKLITCNNPICLNSIQTKDVLQAINKLK